MKEELSKFIRRKKQVKKQALNHDVIFARNGEAIDAYIKSGSLPTVDLSRYEEDYLPWEFLNSQLIIPLNHYELIVEEDYIRSGKVDLDLIKQCLEYGYLQSVIAHYVKRM
ncbi:hypothetical protein G3R49_01735 [Shewanella sp. WXL01]|uniref:hypothetical protein n=1 Tax=Shewanella sp. WXL01 TaxID=2709721 RepID=UPI001438687A|nr:hypothetical protein [Shewanella sp. WXL01]NKF49300.1 hypothetical protein [Shewanella sp. WXL01]